MRKGFTILELLVASMLLGMLVSILTMIFNQSSIAWRTAVASTADLGQTRNDIAEVREEADNAYIYGDKTYLILGLWDENGKLRTQRPNSATTGESVNKLNTTYRDDMNPTELTEFSVGTDKGKHQLVPYIVNVMSAGPDRIFETYDDIWSIPDDFQ